MISCAHTASPSLPTPLHFDKSIPFICRWPSASPFRLVLDSLLSLPQSLSTSLASLWSLSFLFTTSYTPLSVSLTTHYAPFCRFRPLTQTHTHSLLKLRVHISTTSPPLVGLCKNHKRLLLSSTQHDVPTAGRLSSAASILVTPCQTKIHSSVTNHISTTTRVSHVFPSPPAKSSPRSSKDTDDLAISQKVQQRCFSWSLKENNIYIATRRYINSR